MKNVNLFGATTAEKLIALQKAYEDLTNSLFANAMPRGEYSNTVVYEYGDMVESEGSSYLYVYETAAQGISLTNKEYWFKLAGRGTDGNDGVGISHIENNGYTDGNGFTLTHIDATLTDGNVEHFDVQAVNGKDGKNVSDVVAQPSIVQGNKTITPIDFYFNGSDKETVNVEAQNGANGAAQYITINSPNSATNGNLTAEQMNILNASPYDNYIIFADERYIPMDIMDSRGYRIYTHHGEDSNKVEYSKFLYITLSTSSWSLTVNPSNSLYRHNILIKRVPSGTAGKQDSRAYGLSLINSEKEPYVYDNIASVLRTELILPLSLGTSNQSTDGSQTIQDISAMLTEVSVQINSLNIKLFQHVNSRGTVTYLYKNEQIMLNEVDQGLLELEDTVEPL